MTHRVIPLAILFLFCSPVFAEDSRDSAIKSKFQDVVFFGPRQPIFIRLHLQVDGLPFETVWFNYVRESFDRIDTDKDGAITVAEAKHVPVPSQSSRFGEIASILRRRGLWNADIAPFDGKLSPNEFAQFLRSQGYGPFQSPSNDISPGISGARRRVTAMITTRTVSQELFELFDRDNDEEISRSEFEKAHQTLKKFDFDDDGSLSVSELTAFQNPFGQRQELGAGARGAVPIYTIAPDRPLSAIIQRLFDRYVDQRLPSDKNRKAWVFTKSSLGLAPKTFQKFDTDSNGNLDFDEIRYFLKNIDPTIELMVRIGKKDAAKPVVEVIARQDSSRIDVRQSSDGLVSIVLGSVQIELGSVSTGGADVKQFFTSRFKFLDRDKNGYLNQKELERSFYIGPLFDFFDSDADGNLYRAEMLAIIEGKIEAARSRTRMSARDRGRDLFDILDLDRNRQIGPRELKEVVKRIMLWDSDNDGKVSMDEVPQIYQLSFGPGHPTFPDVTLPTRSRNAASPNRPSQPTNAPAWFVKMDRNGDGDVTPREFLGTKKGFAKIDTNNDGLIDAFEAEIAN